MGSGNVITALVVISVYTTIRAGLVDDGGFNCDAERGSVHVHKCNISQWECMEGGWMKQLKVIMYKNGETTEQQRTRSSCTRCIVELTEWNKDSDIGAGGQPPPKCRKDNGNYEKKKCSYYPTHTCSCVDSLTGEIIKCPTSPPPPPTPPPPPPPPPPIQTPCRVELAKWKKDLERGLRDKSKPQCKSDDGNYKEKQCAYGANNPRGECWCVNSVTGKKIECLTSPTTPPPIQTCVDKADKRDCQNWAKTNQCEENPWYMHDYCTRSCGLCK